MKTARSARVLLAVVVIATIGPVAFAHCQIPCGIYDDDMRLTQLREHVTTIEKSMNQIETLGKEKDENHNQIVRWVMNKEQHADELAEIVTYYFMAQRIKPPKEGDASASAKYVRELSLLHRMLVYAMKAKQTIDEAHVTQLRELVDAFEKSYKGQVD